MTRVLLLFLGITGTVLSAESPPPNIILFMADDMGMGDTSAYQSFTKNPDKVQISTPNMDKLARAGILFTDAHTPGTRCTTTRYGLMTGRYCFRSRLKYFVLFGVQGDPLIERDRPTIASLLNDAGYRTGMFGKWHVGLRYRQSNGRPADGWEDADLTEPLYTSPLDHGFDQAIFTSRSHATSGPRFSDHPEGKNPQKGNGPEQNKGPGHIDGRTVIAASEKGKQLKEEAGTGYHLRKLGGWHSDNAMQFLENHLAVDDTASKPFFVYYPANSNHTPYTPDKQIGGVPVAGAARSVAGEDLDIRADYIYENDVALGRLMNWLEETDDPRIPGQKLAHNTLVIFTSDNGAEIQAKSATGPFRSNKGSCYEGGHRVPLIASWPAGSIGDGDATTAGQTSDQLVSLVDLYATFSEIIGKPAPDWQAGEKGGEDSHSILPQLRGKVAPEPRIQLYADNKDVGKGNDPAEIALRWQQWKALFKPSLLRSGEPQIYELYDLDADPRE
ncbi:MAG: arylsulfatase, partial [Verrucomicrobiota bacterium]